VLAQYIDDFRQRFHLVANKLKLEDENGTPLTPTPESVAARNVVDGVALINRYRELGEGLFNELEVMPPPGHKSGLLFVLNIVDDTMDAVGDLLMTESVHQAAKGNYDRSSAALEAASGNKAPLKKLESITTPVPTRTYTHRICALFNKELSFDNLTARANDPRGAAEPRIGAWFSDLLGLPEHIGVVTNFGEFHLGELGISTTDFLYTVQTLPEGGATELEQRITLFARHKFAVPENESIEVRVSQTGGYRYSITDAADLAQQALRLLSTGQQIAPHDLCHPGDIQYEGYQYIDVAVLRARVTEIQKMVDNDSSSNPGLRQKFSAIKTDATVLIQFHGETEAVIPSQTQIKHKPTGTLWQLITDSDIVIEEDGYAEAVATIANRVPLSLESNAEWSLEQTIAGVHEVISIERSQPHNPQGVIQLLLEATKFGIPGATPSDINAPHLEERFENTVAELKKRYSESKKKTPALNINKATLDELREIVGESNAINIIEARDIERFATLDELIRVTGFESDVIASLSAYLTVEEVSPSALIDKLVQAMKAIFGKSFVVLPTFVPHHANGFNQALNYDTLNSHGESRLRLWMQQMAEISQPVAELENTLMFNEAWHQTIQEGTLASFALEQVQLPVEFSESPLNTVRYWIGLSDHEKGEEQAKPNWVRSPLSLVIASHGEIPIFSEDDQGSHRSVTAGFILHEFNDPIPVDKVNTSAAFQYNKPNAQAPQSLLLAVPANMKATPDLWTPEALAEIVCDTIDLAKVRAVDIDALAGETISQFSEEPDPVGGVMPGIYLPADPTQEDWMGEVISKSFKEWVDELEDTPHQCITGEIVWPNLIIGNDEWSLFPHSDFDTDRYCPGLENEDLEGAEIEIKGNVGVDSKRIFFRDYTVASVTNTSLGYVRNIVGKAFWNYQNGRRRLYFEHDGISTEILGRLRYEISKIPEKTNQTPLILNSNIWEAENSDFDVQIVNLHPNLTH